MTRQKNINELEELVKTRKSLQEEGEYLSSVLEKRRQLAEVGGVVGRMVETQKKKLSLPTLTDEPVKDVEIVETGMSLMDKGLNGGLLRGSAYLLAAVEKAGKSSFLRRVMFQMASMGQKIACIDVEQEATFAMRKFVAIAKEKDSDKVTHDEIKKISADLGENLVYMTRTNSPHIISNELGEISVELCTNALERAIEERGCNVCIFDNVTPLGSEGKSGSANQRMRMMSALIALAKRKNVLVICVGHVNSSMKDVLTEEKVKEAIKQGNPEKVMEDTVLTVKRPATKDVYGGSILTQFDGKIFIWRPFQNYNKEDLRKVGFVLFEDMRHCEPFYVQVSFEGKKNLFTEVAPKKVYEIFDGGL